MVRHFLKKENKIKLLLNNKDGVTIVFALVVFMVATVISITIINSAMNNLSRVSSKREYEQARLAVMSAAEYLESNESGLVANLNALNAGSIGKEWTVNVTGDAGATEALKTTITWDFVDSRSSLTAIISSGDGDCTYSAKIKLVYDSASGKWNISKITKS